MWFSHTLVQCSNNTKTNLQISICSWLTVCIMIRGWCSFTLMRRSTKWTAPVVRSVSVCFPTHAFNPILKQTTINQLYTKLHTCHSVSITFPLKPEQNSTNSKNIRYKQQRYWNHGNLAKETCMNTKESKGAMMYATLPARKRKQHSL